MTDSGLSVVYCCSIGQPTGYARAAMDYCMALLDAGVYLSIWPIYAPPDSDKELRPSYLTLLEHIGMRIDAEHPPTHIVVHAMPLDALDLLKHLTPVRTSFPSARMVCITTWETDRVEPDILERLDEEFDLIIVPSGQSAQAFQPEIGVQIVPHAIDAEFWRPRPRDRIRQVKPYVFYSIGTWNDRKNFDGLLRAYLTTFYEKEGVLLRLVVPEYDRNAVPAIQAAANLPGRFPPVEFITNRLSFEELRELHWSSHCFVTASRGEGWGLGAFEAKAVGNPVIFPSYCGTRQFLDEDHERELSICGTLTPCLPMNQALGKTVKVGNAFVNVRSVVQSAPRGVTGRQFWYEPDLEALGGVMSVCVDRAGCEDALLYEAANRLREDYSYREIGRRLVAQLVRA